MSNNSTLITLPSEVIDSILILLENLIDEVGAEYRVIDEDAEVDVTMNLRDVWDFFGGMDLRKDDEPIAVIREMMNIRNTTGEVVLKSNGWKVTVIRS